MIWVHIQTKIPPYRREEKKERQKERKVVLALVPKWDGQGPTGCLVPGEFSHKIKRFKKDRT